MQSVTSCSQSPVTCVCSQIYCILLDHVQWLSPGGLFFFFMGNRGVDLGEREGGEDWKEWKEGKVWSGCMRQE